MTAPDVVVVGHVVQDLTSQGSRLGGAATFAALQAHRLGCSVGVVTRARQDVLHDPQLSGIEFAGRSSETTTTFENTYGTSGRQQRIHKQADGITGDDVPVGWVQADTVLLSPVCAEVPREFSELFDDALIGVGAQGWLRTLDDESNVRAQAWAGPPFWAGCTVLFVSDKDMAGGEGQLDRWTGEVPVVVVTRADHGTRIHTSGEWREIDAFPVEELDQTGAGDIFAAAFLVRLKETDEVADAAKFASAAAACSVEAAGIEGIADRARIEARLAAHPELVLQ